MTRDEFRQQLEAYREASHQYWGLHAEAQDKALEYALSQWRWKKKPEKYFEMHQALSKKTDGFTNFFLRPIWDWYQQEIKSRRSEMRWQLHLLHEAADQIEPVPGDEWNTVHTYDGSDHHTQGMGADEYARGRAVLRSLKYAAFGIQTRITRERNPAPKNPPWYYSRTSKFILEAKCSKLDISIEEYRIDMNLRDWLKACLQQGLNPRVYHPLLPHGLEAKLGLDHFGNDLPWYKEKYGTA